MNDIKTSLKKLLKLNTELSETTSDSLKKRVQAAIENNELEVYYQPQYNYNTKEMSGAEALVRWNTPDKGMLPPSSFIPQLEEYGLIYEVDKCVWRKVCAAMREWKDENLSVPHISVNISGCDICREDFLEYLTSLIKEYGLEPQNLHLEITETVYVKDLEFMTDIIKSLQSAGFVVEMDDFGSGYSSLRALKNVPFDIIKLDMEFLQESETNEKAKNILTSVIEMLNKIKMLIIVEGVECEEQAELLNKSGCKYMQGYYFGNPASKDDFRRILK